ncbi:MAG TPA: serine hydrolase [Pyrinomonadaceae bacterium]|nr:serine hydrolase [Pyrinomonadaceae bacterium]
MLKNEEISEFLQERIDAGDFPSAVYLVAEKGEIVYQDALGLAVVAPEEMPARPDTIYDLASLTKPLVTGLLAAILIESGDLELGRTTDHYLAEFNTREAFDGAGDTSIAELAAHCTLFPAWAPFYLLVENREEVLSEIVRRPMNLDGPAVLYSDLNFIVLMFLIERICGRDIGELAKEKIILPLKLLRTMFNPDIEFRRQIAASELGNEYERKTCIEKFPELRIPDSAFRDRLIWGEVHDGNAYFMGGAAGHAGLFSTAAEVFKIALQFLPEYTTLLKPETCELFRRNLTPGMNEDRSFAFQLASTADSTAGPLMPPESFGHNGFTGTSLWIDPIHDRILILLTNRTHAHPLPFANINATRRRFHDLAVTALSEFN